MNSEFLTSMVYLLSEDANPAVLGPLDAAVTPIKTLVNALLPPLISIVTTVAVIYCVFLGLKLAKAEEPQEREKAKGAIKNAITGYLLIFVLIMVLRGVSTTLENWVLNKPAPAAAQTTDTKNTTDKKNTTGSGAGGTTSNSGSSTPVNSNGISISGVPGKQ